MKHIAISALCLYPNTPVHPGRRNEKMITKQQIQGLMIGGILGLLPTFAHAQPATAPTNATASQPTKEEGKGATAVRELSLTRKSARLLLPVEVNGVKGMLVVDTGAMDTLLRLESAKLLKVTLKDADVAAAGIAGNIENLKTGEIDGSAEGLGKEGFPIVGRRHFATIPVVEDQIDGKPVLGVVGMGDLAKVGAVLDCKNDRLTIHSHGNYKGPKNWIRVKLAKQVAAHVESAFFWVVTAEINGKKGLLVVDTAAQTTVLTDLQFARNAKVDLKGASNIKATGAGSGTAEVQTGVISVLKLNDQVTLANTPVFGIEMSLAESHVNPVDGESLSIVGILGFDQLTRMGAIMDCNQGSLHVSSK